MAENEYLDSYNSQRWQSLVRALCDEASSKDIYQKLENCFCKELRQIQKDMPISELIHAMDSPGKVAQVFVQCNGMIVKELLMEATHKETGRPAQLEAFLIKALDNCLYDIPRNAAQTSGDVNISNARASLESSRQKFIRDEIPRIAKNLAEQPDRAVRRRFNGKSTQTKDERTSEMLNESLLIRSRR